MVRPKSNDASGNRSWEVSPPNADSIRSIMASGSNRLAKRYYYSLGALADSAIYWNDKNGSQVREHWRWQAKFFPNDRYYDPAGRMIQEKTTISANGVGCMTFAVTWAVLCEPGFNFTKHVKLYRYDGLGRRVGWTGTAGHTSTFYDGENVVQHNDADFLPGSGTDNPLVIFFTGNISCATSPQLAAFVTLGGRLYDYHVLIQRHITQQLCP